MKEEIISIGDKNYKDYGTENVVAVTWAHPGAMGAGGEVVAVTSEGDVYCTNFADGTLEWDHLVEFLPVIGQTQFGIFGDDVPPEGWSAYSMGFGNHLLVRGDIDGRFREILTKEEIGSPMELYSSWEGIIGEIVD